jgi:hypothetical protein
MYSLAPVFNISESAILEIIETGFSQSFYNKAYKLLDRYKASLGIDENSLHFIKVLKKRISESNKKIYFDDELNKAISFLEDVVNKKESFFKDYIEKGRYLKSIKSKDYANYKIQSLSYTPFGVFNSRENKSFVKSSNLLYFDIDVFLTKAEKVKIIDFFINDPYIKASWLSFSGKGFGFIVKSNWKNEFELKRVYYKALEYFNLTLQKNYNITKRIFDTQVLSLSRMNIISYGLIKNKNNTEIFKYDKYSDQLYLLLHDYYKKASKKPLPNRSLTEKDANLYKKLYANNLHTKILDPSKHKLFLDKITKRINFTGSEDYNGAIKNYISNVFRYKIDENLIEDFLFNKIPRTKGAEKNYKRLWQCFSAYPEFRNNDPKS